MSTNAKKEFDATLLSVNALQAIESRYADPAPQSDIAAVEGLRAGAVVLMVGGFERYIKTAIEELLNSIQTAHPPVDPLKLPGSMRAEATFKALEIAMRGLPWEPPPATLELRLPAVLNTAKRVAAGEILGREVAQTAGNPDSSQLKKICKTIGYDSVFRHINASFTRRWGGPTAQTFVMDQLDAIVQRRHSVAHTASILSASRNDIATWSRFMQVLVDTLDDALIKHVARLIYRAQ